MKRQRYPRLDDALKSMFEPSRAPSPDEPDHRISERLSCRNLGLEHDGRPGQPDCRPSMNREGYAENKHWTKPLTPAAINEIVDKYEERGQVPLTICVPRGGATKGARRRAEERGVGLSRCRPKPRLFSGPFVWRNISR